MFELWDFHHMVTQLHKTQIELRGMHFGIILDLAQVLVY
jgi:hypothetical protein